MAINPLILQGPITRSQDFTTIKHNEDTKGMVDQMNIQKQFDHQVDNRLHQVQKKDDTENEGKQYDAKEKGNGQYTGDGGQKQKKGKKEQADGKVFLKGQSNFDIKI